ncbi:TauD/TfdA family dioxygenase [Actinomycetes bacterium KLBMP 9797]
MSSDEHAPGALDTVALTEDEAARMRGVCTEVADALVESDLATDAAMATVELAARGLPRRLVAALVAFRMGNQGRALLVRNVPVDRELPATPGDGYLSDWRAVRIATTAQLMMMSYLGDVIAYADEKRGQIVQDVAPVPGAERRQENSGSVCLELHTENGFHPFKPDVLSLLCLRSGHDGAGQTLTGAVGPVLPRLSRVCLDVLRRPLFRIRYSSSFAHLGAGGFSDPVAVLSGPVDDPELVADFHAMEPLSLEARWALEELETVLTSSLTSVPPQDGALLVVDNRRAVHGRTAFTPRYDGADRWLRRCFAVADLGRSRGFRTPGSRVCAPLTAIRGDRYGAPLRLVMGDAAPKAA